ncbi:hypothetical protein M433DRAFT_79497 [Acidomyces richmondensis BFW]|nr:hypothetical protein M433DRAFT_79497 [Acidomyces richmondensis BFW]
MANLASTYRNQGRWKEAEELEVKVVETSRTVLGAEHPSTLTSMANLAVTYFGQERWAEAEELQIQAVAGYKKFYGVHHPDTHTVISTLAHIRHMRGQETLTNLVQEE